jgi:hypothetical protein
MFVEYSKTGKEAKRYKSFSARKVKAMYAKYGEAATNTFLDHLERYGEARLRPLDPAADDNGVLFKKVTEGEDNPRSGTGTTDGAPANSGAGTTGNGNSATVAT